MAERPYTWLDQSVSIMRERLAVCEAELVGTAQDTYARCSLRREILALRDKIATRQLYVSARTIRATIAQFQTYADDADTERQELPYFDEAGIGVEYGRGNSFREVIAQLEDLLA